MLHCIIYVLSEKINIWIESDFFASYCPQGQQGYTPIFFMAPALLTCGQTMSKISESLMENILLTLENETQFLGKTTLDN